MAAAATQATDVVAAGAVVTRKGPEGREALLVHRPKYDDWSFPKGKRDPGEHVTQTACREVLEETGVEIRLGQALRPQLYTVGGGRTKTVHYWIGQVVGDDDVTSYSQPGEVDEVRWVRLKEATRLLTYLDDVHLVEQLRETRKATSALIVLRHAKAVSRADYDGDHDCERPLSDLGRAQAQALVPLLRAYGVTRLVTSPSLRCVQTVTPYAEDQVVAQEAIEELSEEGYHPAVVARLIQRLTRSREGAVLCTHRPVLPQVLAQVGVQEEPLAPAELVVCHHRKGRILSTERHLVLAEA